MEKGTKILIAIASTLTLGAVIYWGVIPRIPGVGFPSMVRIDWMKKTARFRYKGKDIMYDFNNVPAMRFMGDAGFSLETNKDGSAIKLTKNGKEVQTWRN